MVFRTLINSSKRLPLIRFRKGAHQGSTAAPTDSTQQTTSTQTPETEVSNAIEDWELPSRYKRRPITADEIDYINRGGPA